LSEIRATTISDAAGTGPITLTGQSAPKAWISYNGTTNAIRSSFNTSSMTDNATGDFAQNFTSSFDGNDKGCATGSKSNQTSNSGNAIGLSIGSSGGQLNVVVYEVGTKVDALNNFFITTGDLA
jgi:hypothetical protein